MQVHFSFLSCRHSYFCLDPRPHFSWPHTRSNRWFMVTFRGCFMKARSVFDFVWTCTGGSKRKETADQSFVVQRLHGLQRKLVPMNCKYYFEWMLRLLDFDQNFFFKGRKGRVGPGRTIFNTTLASFHVRKNWPVFKGSWHYLHYRFSLVEDLDVVQM